jgi:hypothetical protein
VAVYDASGKNLITTMDIAGCPALAAGSSYTFTLSILDDRIFIGDVSVTPWVTADDVLKGSQDAQLEIKNPFTLNLDNYSDETDAELQEMLTEIFTDYEDVTNLIVTGAIGNRSISTILNSVPMTTLDLTEVTGLTEIPLSAFSGNTTLERISLSSNVTRISYQAFRNCTALKNIDASGVRSIDWMAFYGCSSLEVIDFPNVCSELYGETFSGCKNLREVRLENVVFVEDGVFQGCTALETLYLPNAIELWRVFGDSYDSNESSSINLSNCNLTISYIAQSRVSGVTFQDMETSYTFKSIALASSTDNIVSFTTNLNAWSDRELSNTLYETFRLYNEESVLTLLGNVDETYGLEHNLCEILKPEFSYSALSIARMDFTHLYGLHEIPSGLFQGNSDIRQVELSEDFTTIGSNAFEGSSLKVLNAPGVRDVLNDAFTNCENLQTLYLPQATTLNDPFGTTEASYPECTLTLNLSLQNYVEDDMFYIGETGMYRIQFHSILFEGSEVSE